MKKNVYETPVMEVIEIAVEQVFAASFGIGDGVEDGGDGMLNQ